MARKIFFSSFLLIAFFLIALHIAPSSYAQQTCDEVCGLSSRYGYCTAGGNPDPYGGCQTNYYEYCGNNPSVLCYCCTHPFPTITPPPPAYPPCTGWDGPDPSNFCRNFHSCTPGSTSDLCYQHQGRCVGGYCYPQDCRCGHSLYDCEGGYTCQTIPDNDSCNPSLPLSSRSCRPGYINCTLGAGQISCTIDDQCESECGSPIAYCQFPSGRCYVPSSCGALSEGAGSCTSAANCPLARQRGEMDCGPSLTCCAPAPNVCQGMFGNQGQCYWFNCPVDMQFEGFNPPMDDIGCPPLRACCTDEHIEWSERDALNPRCVAGIGQEGIKTAVGCIPITSNANLLSFILRWAVGVGGGTAFILIIVAGYLIMTSAGDPQRAKAGRELLGAAIAGLLMIIFSVYILDVVGLRILQLPGF